MKKALTISWLFALAVPFMLSRQVDFPKLTGPYFSQKPPGLVPEVFAPGIISTGYHEDGGPAFMPNLREVYYRVAQYPYSVIFGMIEENGIWSRPRTASFSGKYSDCAPFVSYDGKNLFFASNRPLSGNGEPKEDNDIWYVERFGKRWGEPRNLGRPVNSDRSEWKPSLSENRNLYFTSNRDEDRSGWKIYCSQWTGHDYSEPVEFDKKINEAYHPACSCIAKNEGYMIFASSKDPGRMLDLYATFRGENGTWSDPINLGDPVNSARDELFPILSPDNRYLFFVSWRTDLKKYSAEQKSYENFVKLYNSPSNGWGGDFYWVSAEIIERLRPKQLAD